MKVNGIIAEYNPFHKGHEYQIQHMKDMNQADYTVIVMSGNYVQRGEPAIVDKYTRTKMALESGADLVLELPSCYSASSAEFFATGAVTLLDKLNSIDYICFGSECGDLSPLERIADILLKEPESYREALKYGLESGMTYPAARNEALLHYDSSLSQYEELLASPNNILAIEYIKVLHKRQSKIQPVTIKRLGADYHDRRFGESFCSALALRQALCVNHDLKTLSSNIPAAAANTLLSSLNQRPIVQLNDFSQILFYKLLEEHEQGYEKYLDVSRELSDRIQNKLFEFKSAQKFCDKLKSKDMTYTRISRCLLHILLGITKAEYSANQLSDYISYGRVLGFRREAEPLLSAISKNASIPIITRLADGEKALTMHGRDALQADIQRNNIYESICSLKSQTPFMTEYQRQMIIL